MDLKLSGKRAVVSGSTAGIGYAIALGLAREGTDVVVNGRTPARVDAAVARIRGEVSGAKVTGVAADLGTGSGVEQFTRQIAGAEILVNNLGVFDPKPFEKISDPEWMKF